MRTEETCAIMDNKNKSFLCALWFVSCMMQASTVSAAGISPKMSFMLDREDMNEARVVFNLSGLMSLQLPKNITKSYPISAFVNLVISPSALRKPIADWDDAIPDERKNYFRKDYTLNEQKQGWFKLHRVPENWNDARERCELEGAELASPLNTDIHNTMKSIMMEKGVHTIFTGVHSIFSYGDYYSIKGVSINEMPVDWSSAISTKINDRCAEMSSSGAIENVNCDTVSLPYICYKENNYLILTPCGTTDPGYTMNIHTGNCYKLHSELKSWNEAFKTCSAEGGYLAIINDAVEFSTINKMFDSNAVDINGQNVLVHIGIAKWPNSQRWITIHGDKLEKSGFSLWNPTEANYYQNSGNNCGGLNRLGYATVPCFSAHGFVCEKTPDSLVQIPGFQLNNFTEPIDI